MTVIRAGARTNKEIRQQVRRPDLGLRPYLTDPPVLAYRLLSVVQAWEPWVPPRFPAGPGQSDRAACRGWDHRGTGRGDIAARDDHPQGPGRSRVRPRRAEGIAAGTRGGALAGHRAPRPQASKLTDFADGAARADRRSPSVSLRSFSSSLIRQCSAMFGQYQGGSVTSAADWFDPV